MRHLQLHQGIQQHQIQHSYPASRDQYGQQTGNQTASSSSHQRPADSHSKWETRHQALTIKYGYNPAHSAPTQNGMYAPQTAYHGNEPYGTYLASQDSRTAAPEYCNIPSGYNMMSDGNQNFQTTQPATAQPQIATSAATTGYQTNTTSPTYFAQSTQMRPQQNCHTQNRPQANVSQYAPEQPNATVYVPVQMHVAPNNPPQNLNTAMVPSNGLQTCGERQVNFNTTVSNTPPRPAQASFQPAHGQQLYAVSQHQPSNSACYAKQMEYQQNVQWNNTTGQSHTVQPTYNRGNGGNRQVQAHATAQDVSQLNYKTANGHTAKSLLDLLLQTATTHLPYHTNNINSAPTSSNVSGVPPPPYPGRAQPQVIPYQNIHTSTHNGNGSTPMSSDFNGVPHRSHPGRAQPQVTQHQNMHTSTSNGNGSTTQRTQGMLPPPFHRMDMRESSNSLHTNHHHSNNLKRHENGDPNTAYRGPQASSPSSSSSSSSSSPSSSSSSPPSSHHFWGPGKQSERLVRAHQPNKGNAMLQRQAHHPMLPNTLAAAYNTNTDIICNKDTGTSPARPLANIVGGSTNRNVQQICRAVAIVPPISQHAAQGAKQQCSGSSSGSVASDSLKIKEVWSLASDKPTKGDSDDSTLKDTLSTESETANGTTPKDQQTVNATSSKDPQTVNATSSKDPQTVNNTPPKEPQTVNDTPPNEATYAEGQSRKRPSVCPNTDSRKNLYFTLGTVRKLVAVLEASQKYLPRENKTQDLERQILDLFWDGSYNNYTEKEQTGTFDNILRKAVEFARTEDKYVFNGTGGARLKQSTHTYSIYSSTASDLTVETMKSSWRNVSDESMDIDKELANTDIVQENFPSTLEKMEKQGADNNHAENEKADNAEIQEIQTHLSSEDPVDLNIQTRDSPENQENDTVDDVTPNISQIKSEKELTTDYIQGLTDWHKDNFLSILEKAEERTACLNNTQPEKEKTTVNVLQNQPETTVNNLIHRQVDFFSSLLTYTQETNVLLKLITENKNTDKTDTQKMTSDLSEGDAQMDYNSQDLDYVRVQPPEAIDPDTLVDHLATAKEADNYSPPVLDDYSKQCVQMCNKRQDLDCAQPLQAAESATREVDNSSPPVLEAVQPQTCDQQRPVVPDQAMLSMKITVLSVDESSCLSNLFDEPSASPCSGDDSDVEFVSSPQSEVTATRQVQSPEVCGKKDKTTFTRPAHKTVTFYEPLATNDGRNKLELNNSTQLDGKHSNVNPAKDDKKGKQHTLKHQPGLSKDNRHSMKDGQKVLKRVSLPPFQIPTPSPSRSGVKSSTPISPSAFIKKRTTNETKQASSTETEAVHGVKRPNQCLDKGTTTTTQLPPSKKFKTELPKHSENSHRSSNKIAPVKSRQETESSSPVTPSPHHEGKKNKATFRIFGAKKVYPEGKSGKAKYYSDSKRDFPPVLTIVYSPENSARDKIMQSWEGSHVATPKRKRHPDFEKKLNSPDTERKMKNASDRGTEHNASHYKDRREQQQQQQQRPHGKEDHHQSKHKKRRSSSLETRDEKRSRDQAEKCPKKNRPFSLNELRREAETKNRTKMSPGEKTSMALSLLKHFKRSAMYVKH